MYEISNYGKEIGGCHNGDWVKYEAVDFGSEISVFEANLAVPEEAAGQNLEVRIDSFSGTLVGKRKILYDKYLDNYRVVCQECYQVCLKMEEYIAMLLDSRYIWTVCWVVQMKRLILC